MRWYTQIEDPELKYLVDLLRRRLAMLDERPVEATESMARVVQATRHELWRVKHHHVDGYAVRLIVWFDTSNDTAVVIAFAGNKHPNHELWYDRAVKESEAAIDHLLRLRAARKEQP